MTVTKTFRLKKPPRHWTGNRTEKMARMRRNIQDGWGLHEEDTVRFTWDASSDKVTVTIGINTDHGFYRTGPKGTFTVSR